VELTRALEDARASRAAATTALADALDALHHSQDAIPRLDPAESKSVDLEEIRCGVCGSGDDAEENPIVLCDHAGCNRAFHARCLDPPASQEELGDDDDDWVCRACAAEAEALDVVVADMTGADGPEEDEWGLGAIESVSELAATLRTVAQSEGAGASGAAAGGADES